MTILTFTKYRIELMMNHLRFELRSRISLPALLLIALYGVPVQGGVLLGSFGLVDNGKQIPSIDTTLDFHLVTTGAIFTATIAVPPPTASGTIIFDTTSNPAEFAGFVASLTDGTDFIVGGFLTETGGSPGGSAQFESTIFAGVSTNGVDLGGYTIESLVFDYEIEYVSIQGSNLLYRMESSIDVYTSVPEPTTLALTAFALLGIGYRRRN